MELELFEVLGISLGLGLLVGLQRQYQNSKLAGIRTFPLVTLLGTLSALLSVEYGGWVVAAGFVSITAIVVIGNFLRIKTTVVRVGLTTEVAMLLMFTIGAYLVHGSSTVAIALGATVAVLLQMKGTLHGFVDRIGEKDIRAIMKLVVISMVILPVLPNRTYGPYDVINPHNIWLMVVLIVSISLLGYFAYKAFGGKAGAILGGSLGGLISSTATTVSYARRTKSASANTMLAALVILIASTIAFVRILLEVTVVAPDILGIVAPPFIAMFLLMTVIAGVAYIFKGNNGERMPEQGNPAQLKVALVFGLVYGVVIFASAAAKDFLGEEGLYIVGILSGLTNVDAITLSTARLMTSGNIDLHNGWRVILIGALSNIAFKIVLAGFLGSRSLFAKIALLLGLVLIGGIAILWLWPEELDLLTEWF
ncbi:uncharacterized membrane protein (DUF4010 family) [Pontibacter ummariensis]|uniref:Uncharacterized membrane protein, DUF4010 family n=1 Tax=Pontibacter ummariensis TaxID=1610492 RepID=A0A239ES68_9BACT|nr:MgtC/SapB family protein [Pontibacter ummariensis]PRY12806.1 uncharacterized membrane protein (DUF4010 family) [Pontibacter ummariensis]SNS46704.1 Uncharacterized membrane protein, DUF4010 family [Pontibacter ummariensis]